MSAPGGSFADRAPIPEGSGAAVAASSGAMAAEAVLRALGSPARLVSDSRRVTAGDAFAAYPGERHDGRRFIADALQRGATGVLWEPAQFVWNAEWRVPNVPVPGLARRLGELADRAFGQPSRGLWMVAITGTNGKTSCAHWIAQAFAAHGRRSAVLGTLGNGMVGDPSRPLAPATHTTMDAALLHETLAGLRAAGAQVVAMEVSSHGLDQGRVDGTAFDLALFTNLSRDHLDYHGTMEAYAEAKARLFGWTTLRAAVVNIEDPFGVRCAERARQHGTPVIGYGLGAGEVRASAVRSVAAGVEVEARTPWGDAAFTAPVTGTFNVANLLGVLAVLGASGLTPEQASRALTRVEAPPGRMQRFGGGARPWVIVDYAHSPDALAKVLAALRPLVPARGRLLCVFGCGGDRDRGKRPQMARVAELGADVVVVTSDNPRSEPPQAIIDDILAGLRQPAQAKVEPDRAQAIRHAIGLAGADDLVVVAGKGHEDYQEIGGVRHPFRDADQVAAALAAWRPR